MAVFRPGDCSFFVIKEDHRWQEGSTLGRTGKSVEDTLIGCLEDRFRHDSTALISTVQKRADPVIRGEKEDREVFKIRDIKTFDGTFL